MDENDLMSSQTDTGGRGGGGLSSVCTVRSPPTPHCCRSLSHAPDTSPPSSSISHKILTRHCHHVTVVCVCVRIFADPFLGCVGETYEQSWEGTGVVGGGGEPLSMNRRMWFLTSMPL